MARIIVAGYMVRNPQGGLLWADLPFLLGLARLGHDVYFFEESGWPNSCYDYSKNRASDDATWGVRVISRLMRRFNLERHWVYRDAKRRHYGLSAKRTREIISQTDVLLNLSGATWFEEFEDIPRRVFVDRDPGFTQFGSAKDPNCLQDLRRHTDFFVYAHNVGQPACPVPTLGFRWRPLCNPLELAEWPTRFESPSKKFTTIMSWDAYGGVRYRGRFYGPKSTEFLKFMKLPSRTFQELEVAIADGPIKKMVANGWHVADGLATSRTADSYRDYIQRSRAEFSIAKNGYVRSRTGVIPDRTLHYLASGKPVVLQETGYSDWLPVGEGLLSFSDEGEALTAIARVNRDYRRHCKAARAIAEEFFDSNKVLRHLLQSI